MLLRKTYLRRNLALLVMLAFALSLLPLSAFAEGETTEGHYHSFACYTLTCEEDHAHSVQCFATDKEPVCGLEQGDQHTHGGNYDCQVIKVLGCGAEEHQHDETCEIIARLEDMRPGEILITGDDPYHDKDSFGNEYTQPEYIVWPDPDNADDEIVDDGISDEEAGIMPLDGENGIAPLDNSDDSIVDEGSSNEEASIMPHNDEDNGIAPLDGTNGNEPEADIAPMDDAAIVEESTETDSEVAPLDDMTAALENDIAPLINDIEALIAPLNDDADRSIALNKVRVIQEQYPPLSDAPQLDTTIYSCGKGEHQHGEECYVELYMCRPIVFEVSNLDELQKAVNNGYNHIKVITDIKGNVTIDFINESIANNDGNRVILDLNGHTITGDGTDAVFNIYGGTVIMKNGVITGGGKKTSINWHAYSGGGIDTVGTNLTLEDCAIEDNQAGHGGGIWTENGTLSLLDCIVQNNAAGNGGGLAVKNSVVTLNNTIIDHNIADGGTVANPSKPTVQYSVARGGGIFIAETGGSVTMNGGAISNNTAHCKSGGIRSIGGIGGGIYIPTNGSFTLNSGLIDNNIAGCPTNVSFDSPRNGAGGGVYVDKNASFTMNSGTISENKAYAWANSSQFNGGGIYMFNADNVQIFSGRISDNFTNAAGGGMQIERGTLHLTDVTITENYSHTNGGGIWYCDAANGGGKLYATSGALIADNQAENPGREFFSTEPWFIPKDLHLPTRNREGTSITWVNDRSSSSTNKDIASVNVEEMGLQNFLDTYQQNANIALTNTTSAATAGASLLFIVGNEARSGGGIGCNGNLIIGENRDVELTIEKKWVHTGNANAPESNPEVTIDLLNNGYVIDTVVLNDANNWQETLIDLPGNGNYSLKEHNTGLADYKFNWNLEKNDDKHWTITGINTYSPEVVSLTINKVWETLDGQTPKIKSVEVKVKNGETVVGGEPITLTSENKWQATLNNLPKDGDYSVEEITVDGYTVAYASTKDANGNIAITITNKENKPDTATLNITKLWKDADGNEIAAPEGDVVVTIKVLDEEGATIATAILSAVNNWSATVNNLPADGKYSLAEEPLAGYAAEYGEITGEDNEFFVTITNTKLPPEPISLTVNKVWNDNNSANRPTSILVGLSNGESIQEYVTLNADNNWSYTWDELAADVSWSVAEVGIVGYTSTQNREDNVVTITNTLTPPVTPPPGGDNPPDNPPPTEPNTPTTPPVTPPPGTLTELPDPNVPGAPPEVTVVENDVPLAYVRTWDPETEEYVYIPEEDVPLANMDPVPPTGDNTKTALWIAICLAMLSGMVILTVTAPRRKENK